MSMLAEALIPFFRNDFIFVASITAGCLLLGRFSEKRSLMPIRAAGGILVIAFTTIMINYMSKAPTGLPNVT